MTTSCNSTKATEGIIDTGSTTDSSCTGSNSSSAASTTNSASDAISVTSTNLTESTSGTSASSAKGSTTNSTGNTIDTATLDTTLDSVETSKVETGAIQTTEALNTSQTWNSWYAVQSVESTKRDRVYFSSAGSTSFAIAVVAAIMNTVVASTRSVISVTIRFVRAVMFGWAIGFPLSFGCGSDDSEKGDNSELHVFVKICFLYCCFLRRSGRIIY